MLSDDIFRPRWLSKAGPVLAGAVAGVALTALILVSPVLMSVLFVGSVDWTQASIIGQAYGLASAVLGGLAFCGVAYSLILQRRETRIALLGTSFQQYLELTKLALDDPRFLYVQDRPPDRPHNDLFAYANLLLSSIYHGWLRTSMRKRCAAPRPRYLLDRSCGALAAGRAELDSASSAARRAIHANSQ